MHCIPCPHTIGPFSPNCLLPNLLSLRSLSVSRIKRVFHLWMLVGAKQIRDLSGLFTTENGWSMMGIKGSARRARNGDDGRHGDGDKRDTYMYVQMSVGIGRCVCHIYLCIYGHLLHCLSEVAGQLVFGTKNLRMAKSRQAVIYLVLPSSSYAASKIQLQTGQINQCTRPVSQNGTGRRVKCIFGTRQLFRFLASLEHFSWGFPSPSLNRAILSAKIYDTFVGSILAKSYRNFLFFSGPRPALSTTDLQCIYFQPDLYCNELRTENPDFELSSFGLLYGQN